MNPYDARMAGDLTPIQPPDPREIPRAVARPERAVLVGRDLADAMDRIGFAVITGHVQVIHARRR